MSWSLFYLKRLTITSYLNVQTLRNNFIEYCIRVCENPSHLGINFYKYQPLKNVQVQKALTETDRLIFRTIEPYKLGAKIQ